MIVGDNGQVEKFDGTSFVHLSSSTGYNLWDIDWKPDGSYALIVSDRGEVLKYDGNTFTIQSTGSSEDFQRYVADVDWNPDGSYAIIVGWDGYWSTGGWGSPYWSGNPKIWKYDGSTFTEYDSSELPRGVSFKPDGSYALIVGENGAAWTYDGTNLNLLSTGVNDNLYAVSWKPDGSYAIIVGASGTVLKYDGSSFTILSNGTATDLKSVDWKPDGSYALITGANGYVTKFDGASFTPLTSGVETNLNKVSFNSTAALIVGDSGTMLMFDGTSFTPMVTGTTENLNGVRWSVDGSYAVVVGDSGTMFKVIDTPSPPDTTPPDAITDLAASSPTTDSITLTWTAPGDDGNIGTAAGYVVKYSTSGPITDANWDSATTYSQSWTPLSAGSTETHTTSGLSSNTTYWFAVKAYDEVPNYSGISNTPSETTTTSSDTAPPAAITDLVASSPTTDSITLTWTAPGDDGDIGTAAGYVVKYSTSGPITDANWDSATTYSQSWTPLSAGSTETHTTSGLSSNTTYWFAVKAYDEVPNYSGISNTPSETTTTSSDTTPPDAITDLAASSPTTDSITLTWTAPGDEGDIGTAAGYVVKYSTSGAITDANWDTATTYNQSWTPLSAGSTETHTVSGLSSGTTYWFAIKAYDEVPNYGGISNSPDETTATPGDTTTDENPQTPKGTNMTFPLLLIAILIILSAIVAYIIIKRKKPQQTEQIEEMPEEVREHKRENEAPKK